MIPPVVLLLAEPDLGTALLFPPMLFAMLVAAGARLRHLGVLVALGVAAVVINVAIIYVCPEDAQVLKPHQQDRIKAMVSQVLGDKRYIRTIGYQQYKAMTLIGAGGVTGYGEERA